MTHRRVLTRRGGQRMAGGARVDNIKRGEGNLQNSLRAPLSLSRTMASMTISRRNGIEQRKWRDKQTAGENGRSGAFT